MNGCGRNTTDGRQELRLRTEARVRACGPDGTNKIDIEFAQWGKPGASMGNYTVWPAREGLRSASRRFPVKLNGEYSTHRFTWNSMASLYRASTAARAATPTNLNLGCTSRTTRPATCRRKRCPFTSTSGRFRDSRPGMAGRSNSWFGHSSSHRLHDEYGYHGTPQGRGGRESHPQKQSGCGSSESAVPIRG